ncbi:MAG: DUF616 domain-containing protein [Bacteroidales bacterium]|nr:DUF616 domain-containing protein [Bacteroidales bacterium]
MTDIKNRLKKIYRRQRIRCCLESLRNDFLLGGADWANLLNEYGYHRCLQLHPAILFSKREANKRKRSHHNASARLNALKSLIEQGSFQDAKDRAVLRDIGIHQYFVQDISRMLSDCGIPFVPYSVPKRNLCDEKVAVYTALTGEYDSVHEILYKQPGVDYILYTNNKNLTSSTWDVRYVDSSLDDVLLSREIKMLPDKYLDKQYTASVYVDANAFIYGDIANLVSMLNEKTTFAVTRHSNTDSVKNEIEVCIKTKGINRIQAETQYERYCAEGFKDDMGLAECNILIRRSNDEELGALMELWFQEFCKGIRRDQISLPPCIQKRNFEKYMFLEGSTWHNQFCVILGGHRKSK